jgi:glucose-1-phosphate thymidylyltransferase
LGYNRDKPWIASSLQNENSVVIAPCYIGENVILKNSVIGPGVSLGDGVVVDSSVINNSIVLPAARITNANIAHSMIGTQTQYIGVADNLSLGDYSVVRAK